MANCIECKRKRAACAETDHSPEWVLSKELIKANNRLRILCRTSLAVNAFLIVVFLITH
jgi:hypothetical protein